MSNDELPEPDFDFDEETEDDQTPDYWGCNSCGYTCAKRPMGGECPKCMAIMEESFF